MSEPCPHLEAILADDERFARGYYESGRERADLIAAVATLKNQVEGYRNGFLDLESVSLDIAQDRAQWRQRAQQWKEAARGYRQRAQYARHRPGCGAEQRDDLPCRCGYGQVTR